MEEKLLTTDNKKGLELQPYFVKSGEKAYEQFEWGSRNINITDRDGKLIYDGRDVRFPTTWTDMAARIVGGKYFYKGDGDDYIEKGVDRLGTRVVDALTKKTVEQEIISQENAEVYNNELLHAVYNQAWSANSPVWFNVGLHDSYNVIEKSRSHSHWITRPDGTITNDIDAYEHPQAAACFIQSINDDMASLMDHAKKEAMLFKFGSGTGTNFGNIRGVGEPLSGGGYASGQTSFMKIYDVIAGSVQSGGKTRRAAKMVIEPCDHPDLFRFINWKVNEEKKALWLCSNIRWAPKDANDLESDAYKSVTGQNGNNTVRVTDAFMEAALRGDEWSLWFRTADRVNEEVEIPLEEYKDDRYLPDKRFIKKLTNKRKIVNAGEVLENIVRAAAVTGDPALQYHDTINKWHTTPNTAPINASNPCSEFMYIDDSACNLASINLIKLTPENTKEKSAKIINTTALKQLVKLSIAAQETLVDYGSYPSEKIAQNSHDHRPLGLGYTNLGALLMESGVAYDSDEGRAIASTITSLMTAYAYQTSAELASQLGAFKEFEKNKEPMLNVIKMHRDATNKISASKNVEGLENLVNEAKEAWNKAFELGEKYGYRNSQVTLLAPTGTIGFMMDADCLGIEPMPAIQYKKGLAGGGKLEIELKPCVGKGLVSLGYQGTELEDIVGYIKENETVEGAPHLRKEHYKVFATAFGEGNTIPVDGHLKMMAAVQPFLSGAISKTVNLPKGSTIEDVKRTYVEGWKLGLKSISLYVDGSKGIQPITVKTKKDNGELKWGERDKPKNSMLTGGFIESAQWSVKIGDTGVRLIVGEYDNRAPKDSPAEFFVEFGHAGSEYSAAYSTIGKAASRSRQRGESVAEFIDNNRAARGSVNGFTNHPFIKKCNSIEDMFAKIVQLEYLGDTSVCDVQPNERQMGELRCNVLANRRRDRHYQSRIDFIETAMEEGKLIDVFPLFEDELSVGEIAMTDIFCTKCGHATVLSGANCRKCNNCGESGGCG